MSPGLHGERGLGNSREGKSTTTERERKKTMNYIENGNYNHVVKMSSRRNTHSYDELTSWSCRNCVLKRSYPLKNAAKRTVTKT
jgi:hypothetical protein